MGHIGVDDEAATGSQIGLVAGCVEILGSEPGRRDVHRRRLQNLEANPVAGGRVDELEPPTVRAQTELLRHEIGRLVDVGFPHAEHGPAIAVGIVLERAATEPAQPIEARREFERDADAGDVVESVGHDDHVRVDLRAVIEARHLVVVLDEIVGAEPVDTGVDPMTEAVTADADPAPEVGQQLEPVVVDRRPEQHTTADAPPTRNV